MAAVHRVQSIRASLSSQRYIHGCCQRSQEVVFISTMPSVSWDQTDLVLMDAYSKYPCIHPTQSVSQDNDRLTGTKLCSLWLSPCDGIGQRFEFPLRGVPDLVQITKHYSLNRSAVSLRYQWRCGAPRSNLQAGAEKICIIT